MASSVATRRRLVFDGRAACLAHGLVLARWQDSPEAGLPFCVTCRLLELEAEVEGLRRRLRAESAIRPDGALWQPTDLVIHQVLEERQHQETTWGRQEHDLPIWLAILQEEVGEVARAVLDAGAAVRGPRMVPVAWDKLLDRDQGATDESIYRVEQARAELLQVAAVAVATTECIDRHRRSATCPLRDEPGSGCRRTGPLLADCEGCPATASTAACCRPPAPGSS